jgi:hypothetical protein
MRDRQPRRHCHRIHNLAAPAPGGWLGLLGVHCCRRLCFRRGTTTAEEGSKKRRGETTLLRGPPCSTRARRRRAPGTGRCGSGRRRGFGGGPPRRRLRPHGRRGIPPRAPWQWDDRFLHASGKHNPILKVQGVASTTQPRPGRASPARAICWSWKRTGPLSSWFGHGTSDQESTSKTTSSKSSGALCIIRPPPRSGASICLLFSADIALGSRRPRLAWPCTPAWEALRLGFMFSSWRIGTSVSRLLIRLLA